MFETFNYFIGSQHSIAFFNDLLFVDDSQDKKVWKLSKNVKQIPCPDCLKLNIVFFLDKIQLLIYVDGQFLQCCEVDEGNDGNLQLYIKVSKNFSFDSCLPYLDMLNANIVYLFKQMATTAILDLENKTIKTVQYQKKWRLWPKKNFKKLDGVFLYYDCTGSPSDRSYRSYPELFKAIWENDKSIFKSKEKEIHIDLRTHWTIFVVSKEIQDQYLPVSTIDSHVALIIEGMRNERHFVVKAELILNHRNKFEIKMESIDKKTSLSEQLYISCGWERDQDTVP